MAGPPGAEAFVSGTPAIQADLDPIFEEDLLKGEAIALPIALLVLLAVFGLSFAVLMPFIVAASTIMATLGIVWIVAHYMTMAIYVTNLVQLIGLGIAIDYSLLIVYRYREELERGDSKDEAVVRTMATAGRAVVFSGVTVAIGLALLLFMPLPFMVSMGVGGFLIPLLSILAAITLQPALLSLFGRRGTRRVHVADFLRDRLRLPVPRFAGDGRRRAGALGSARALDHAQAAALPRRRSDGARRRGRTRPRSPADAGLRVWHPSVAGIDPGLQRPPRGRRARRARPDPDPRRLRSGERDPHAGDPERDRRADRLRAPRSGGRARRLRRRAAVRAPPYVDATGRYAYLSVAGRHEYGALAAQDFARRLREKLIPAVGFPEGATVLAGGGPPQGIDFIDSAYGAFPWLVLAVLLLTYLTLMRAFRSLLLPLKAVVLNLLAIAATYGLIVIVFKYGIGAELLGLYQLDQVEAWIPIFLFAMLFGLSMDYEVFLVSRMREFWDEGETNEEAVAHGLERTGRIVTAAAIVMVAAFSGFAAGSIVGLQQFGLGLAIAIFIDATLIRAVLVPALMRLFGRYNWWLPASVARLIRVAPSPLATQRAPIPGKKPLTES